jgi:NitT/TauT family transport system ATP-binding protein
MAKVDIQDVRKIFRWEKGGQRHELLALDGVSLEVQENEFLLIIGPSGCGKSTLLRIVAGLIDRDDGEIRIDGNAVTGPGPERAMVFQDFGLFPWKTVLDNVKFPLDIRNVPEDEAAEIARRHLKQVGLDGFEDAHPHQLSGGMQQRVGVARALAIDPDILLMDEPFGAIDAQTRELMQEELARLWAESRKTVLFVTHDLDEAVILADRIAVLSRSPGTVRTIVPVDLPRPRWEYDVRAHPVFAAVRQEIWSMLRSDLTESTAAERRSVVEA